jgi:hypothetical protein
MFGPRAEARQPTLAFEVLLQGLRREPRARLLDLGPALGSNVEFFAALPARLRIADFYGSLTPVERADAGDGFASAVARVLPLAGDDGYDALLFWDLLDYLQPSQIARLAAHLAPACRPGTVLFAMVATGKYLPAEPRRYRLVDRKSILYEGVTDPTRPGWRYRQPVLEKAMPGFHVTASYLLRNGIQEYLFTYS